MFTIINDPNTTVKQFLEDLEKNKGTVFQRNMSFNPDASKQA